jgi:hypothetical protein
MTTRLADVETADVIAGAVARARTLPAWLLPFIVGAIAFGAGALIIEGYVIGVAHDDGMYVILGKALASGRGYRWLHVPGAPPATHFPPGYPAVLALLWWIFPHFPANVTAFELANALFMGLAAVGVFHLVRSRFAMSDFGSAILALATTLGVPTLTLSVLVMSEPLFLALLLPILLYAERVVDGERQRTRDVVALALLVGMETLVRTHGIALLGALTILLTLRRRFRATLLFTGVAVATLIPWQLWVATHSGVVPPTMQGNYESYGSWFAAGMRSGGVDLLYRTLVRTLGELTKTFEALIAPSMPNVVRIVAVAALATLGSIGARTLWRRAPVTALFVGLYSAMVVVWPFWPARFIWAIWPLIVLLPTLGVRELLQTRYSSRVRQSGRVAAIAAGVLLACGYTTYNVRGYRHQWWASIPRSISDEVRPLLVWVATRTPSDALLATEAETSVYLYTGRPAVPVGTFTVNEFFMPRTPAQNAAVINTVIDYYHPKAVVVSSGAMRDAVRELALSQPPSLVVVDTFPKGGLVLIPEHR